MCYADVGYLLDLYNGESQTGYLFTCSGTTISWCSVKQTITTTLVKSCKTFSIL